MSREGSGDRWGARRRQSGEAEPRIFHLSPSSSSHLWRHLDAVAGPAQLTSTLTSSLGARRPRADKGVGEGEWGKRTEAVASLQGCPSNLLFSAASGCRLCHNVVGFFFCCVVCVRVCVCVFVCVCVRMSGRRLLSREGHSIGKLRPPTVSDRGRGSGGKRKGQGAQASAASRADVQHRARDRVGRTQVKEKGRRNQ